MARTTLNIGVLVFILTPLTLLLSILRTRKDSHPFSESLKVFLYGTHV
jgi:hypothetical protein